MPIDPVIKMFWILIAAILLTNAAWLIYVSLIEDEIEDIYKALKLHRLSSRERKKLSNFGKEVRK